MAVGVVAAGMYLATATVSRTIATMSRTTATMSRTTATVSPLTTATVREGGGGRCGDQKCDQQRQGTSRPP